LIAEGAHEDGIDFESLPLKVGLFGAEPWSERMREEIESRLNIVALNVYGLSEVIGPGVSVECNEKKGNAHLRGSLHSRNHRSHFKPTPTGG
jgi:phenylacetate-CoA ligase